MDPEERVRAAKRLANGVSPPRPVHLTFRQRSPGPGAANTSTRTAEGAIPVSGQQLDALRRPNSNHILPAKRGKQIGTKRKLEMGEREREDREREQREREYLKLEKRRIEVSKKERKEILGRVQGGKERVQMQQPQRVAVRG
jgi:hypothetical protein